MQGKILGLAACLVALATTPPVEAAERFSVALHSGFSLEADRVETLGEQLVLHLAEGNIVVARSDVESISAIAAPQPARAEEASAHPAPPPSVEARPIRSLVRDAALRHGLPEAFVESVAEAESALRPEAVSPKGARGVMQLMPETAEALGVDAGDPAENIDGGARLLRDLLLRYQYHPDQVRLALAAYNAGAGAVQKYDGVPPYRETTQYVERVLSRYRAKSKHSAAESK